MVRARVTVADERSLYVPGSDARSSFASRGAVATEKLSVADRRRAAARSDGGPRPQLRGRRRGVRVARARARRVLPHAHDAGDLRRARRRSVVQTREGREGRVSGLVRRSSSGNVSSDGRAKPSLSLSFLRRRVKLSRGRDRLLQRGASMAARVRYGARVRPPPTVRPAPPLLPVIQLGGSAAWRILAQKRYRATRAPLTQTQGATSSGLWRRSMRPSALKCAQVRLAWRRAAIGRLRGFIFIRAAETGRAECNAEPNTSTTHRTPREHAGVRWSASLGFAEMP